MERKLAIQKLKSLIRKESTYLISGSWKLDFLSNYNTRDYCQIIEASDLDGLEQSFPMHIHQDSQEIFYQIRGETKFWDGTILKIGEVKIVPPAMLHSATLCRDGLCLIIVHPIEPAYRKEE